MCVLELKLFIQPQDLSFKIFIELLFYITISNISMKKTFITIFIILMIDFLGSNLLFKKMGFWNYDKLTNHYWRIPSKVYHHDLLPNINVIEPWGFKLKKK